VKNGRMHNKWLIAITVMSGAIMAAFDTSIVNVALPQMRGSLGASVEEITWVSTGYILSSVIIMPMIAFLTTRFGRKRFYIFSALLFTCFSTLCGFAWDLQSMILFRIVQGIGGGTLMVVSLAILRETFPPEEQGIAMGIYGFGVILGPAIGPTLGGWLTDSYSWQWIFYIKWPLGILNVLLIIKFIYDPPYLVREKGNFDLAGLFFMAIGLGAVQIILAKGNRQDWFESNLIVVLAIISIAAISIFIWRELTTEKPAVDLRLLKNVNFSSACLFAGFLHLALMGSLFLFPLFLQQLLGYPVLDSGLALLPRSVAMMVAMPLGGRMYNAVGPRILIGAGTFLNILSFYQFAHLSLETSYWDIFFPQVCQGLGFGFIFVALSTAALSGIENRSMTAAAGLFNVISQVFGSAGIALIATLLTRHQSWSRAILVERVTVFSDTATETIEKISSMLLSKGINPSDVRDSAIKTLESIVMKQADMLAYEYVFYLLCFLFIILISLVFFIKQDKKFFERESV